MLSVDGVNKLSKEIYKDDPEKLKKAAELMEKCKSGTLRHKDLLDYNFSV